MVKNLPANIGDMGLIPGPERFHVEQLSPYATTIKPVLQSPCPATKKATAMRSLSTATRE